MVPTRRFSIERVSKQEHVGRNDNAVSARFRVVILLCCLPRMRRYSRA